MHSKPKPWPDDCGEPDDHFPTLFELGLRPDELQALRRQGYLTCDWRLAGGAGYWRLRFRFKQRARTVYLGTDDQRVEEVRQELTALRRARLNQRRLADAVKQCKRAVRGAKKRSTPVVASLGYHFHGDVLRKLRRHATEFPTPAQIRVWVQTQPHTFPQPAMQPQAESAMQTQAEPAMQNQAESAMQTQAESVMQTQAEPETPAQSQPETQPQVQLEMQPQSEMQTITPPQSDAAAEMDIEIQVRAMQDQEVHHDVELTKPPAAAPQGPLTPPGGPDPGFCRRLQTINEYGLAAAQGLDAHAAVLRGVNRDLLEAELYIGDVLLKNLRGGLNSAQDLEASRLTFDTLLRLTKQIGQFVRLEQQISTTEPRDASPAQP